MKLVERLLVFVFLLIALVILYAAVKRPQEVRQKAAPATTLSLSPASLTVAPGQIFEVNVVIDSGDNTVSAAEVILSFVSGKLEAQSLTAGDFLTTQLVAGSVGQSNASITLGSPPASPKKGTGKLATATFKAGSSTGQTVINFDQGTQVAGIGESGNVLVGKTGATVTIQSGANLPTPTSTSTPPSTPTPTLFLPPRIPTPFRSPTPRRYPTPTLAYVTPTPTPESLPQPISACQPACGDDLCQNDPCDSPACACQESAFTCPSDCKVSATPVSPLPVSEPSPRIPIISAILDFLRRLLFH